MSTNCNTAQLSAYGTTQTWGASEVHYRCKRAAICSSPKELVDAILKLQPTEKPSCKVTIDSAFEKENVLLRNPTNHFTVYQRAASKTILTKISC